VSKKLKDTYPRLGELLVRKRAATPEVVDQALAIQRAELAEHRTPRKIGEILIERRVLDRTTIREILEEQKVARGEKRKFKLSLADDRGVAVLTVDGQLERSRIDTLTRVLERLMNRGFVRICVDARKLAAIDSDGISAFIPYIDESRARGGDIKFLGLSSSGQALFEQLGLDKFVHTFDSETDAVRAFDLRIDEYMSRGALGEYISETSSREFHLSYCRSAQRIGDTNRVYYESKWHARKDGKQPCRRCRP